MARDESDGVIKIRRPTPIRISKSRIRRRRLMKLGRETGPAVLAGVIVATLLGAVLVPPITRLHGGGWLLVWLISWMIGIAITWTIRFSLKWKAGRPALVVALFLSVGSLFLGVYVAQQVGNVPFGVYVAQASLPHIIGIGVNILGVAHGFVWTPTSSRILAVRNWRRWLNSLRRASAARSSSTTTGVTGLRPSARGPSRTSSSTRSRRRHPDIPHGGASSERPGAGSPASDPVTMGRRPTIIVGSAAEAVCAFCGDMVPEDNVAAPAPLQRFVCPRCGCVQHRGCWERYGGCVALGPPH